VASSQDTRAAMHAEPDVPLLAHRRLARVKAHTHTQVRPLRPCVLGEPTLRRDRRGDRILRTRKGGEERIALRVDLTPTVLSERPPQNPPVLGKHLTVALPQLLQQARRALDIREQEGDSASRKLLRRAHEKVLPPSELPVDPGMHRLRAGRGGRCYLLRRKTTARHRGRASLPPRHAVDRRHRTARTGARAGARPPGARWLGHG
jgi:hypothetical protein